MDEIITGFPSTMGGVLTREVGAVTGELILTTRTVPGKDLVEVLVSYVGSDDLYTVAGSPLPLSGRGHEKVHWDAIEKLQTPVGDGWKNEPPASLAG